MSMKQRQVCEPEWFSLSLPSLRSCLAGLPLFQDIPTRDLDALAQTCRCARYPQGAQIYPRGCTADYLYIVCSGAVALFVGYEGSVDLMMKIRKKGDYFGELGILSRRPQPCNAVAQEPASLLFIPAQPFLELAWKHHAILEQMTGELVDRLVMSSHKLINTIYMDAAGKLAFTIIRLLSSGSGGGDVCEIAVSQHDLARSSGLARQTVVKLLTEWREAGWVCTQRKRIVICNQNALMDIILRNESRGTN